MRVITESSSVEYGFLKVHFNSDKFLQPQDFASASVSSTTFFDSTLLITAFTILFSSYPSNKFSLSEMDNYLTLPD